MIVIAIPCLLKGGTEFQTLQLVRTLIAFQQSVMLIVYFETDQEMLQIYQASGAEIRCLNWKRSLSTWRFLVQLTKLFKELSPSVVHVQYMAPGALPILAAKFAGVKRIIATVHQPYTPSHGWKAKLFLRLAAMFCHPFLAVSQNAEVSWFGHSNLMDPNIPIGQQARHLTFYNAVNAEAIQKMANQVNRQQELDKLGLSGKRVIGAVARLRHEKGIDLLIHSFFEIIQKEKEVYLLLVGDGPDRNQYEKLIQEKGITKYVHFYGAAKWERAMALMSLMEVVVVPSRFEGFGLTAAEAMAMEKPVIAADNFGLKELITDKQEGLLFENENPEDLTQRLLLFLNEPQFAKDCAKNAKQKIDRLFDLPVFIQKTKSLYKL